jgi:hypothetical protein
MAAKAHAFKVTTYRIVPRHYFGLKWCTKVVTEEALLPPADSRYITARSGLGNSSSLPYLRITLLVTETVKQLELCA